MPDILPAQVAWCSLELSHMNWPGPTLCWLSARNIEFIQDLSASQARALSCRGPGASSTSSWELFLWWVGPGTIESLVWVYLRRFRWAKRGILTRRENWGVSRKASECHPNIFIQSEGQNEKLGCRRSRWEQETGFQWQNITFLKWNTLCISHLPPQQSRGRVLTLNNKEIAEGTLLSSLLRF